MSDQPNRRDVLRTVGTATAAGLSLTGTAAADTGPTRPQALAQFRDRDARVNAFERHARPVLEELANRSIIESASPEEFPHDRFDEETTRLTEAADDVSGVTVFRESDGTARTLLMSAKNTPTHTVRLFVKPETDESYAFVSSKDDGSSFVVKPSLEPTMTQEVTTEDHCGAKDDYICGDRCETTIHNCTVTCSKFYTTTYLDWFKCGSDFHDCCSEVTGTDCGAEDCWETCTFGAAC